MRKPIIAFIILNILVVLILVRILLYAQLPARYNFEIFNRAESLDYYLTYTGRLFYTALAITVINIVGWFYILQKITKS